MLDATALCIGAGIVCASLLTVAFLGLHWILDRRSPRRVTAYDVDGLEAELDAISPFTCPRWRASRGDCCPPGTIRFDCPGIQPLRARRA